MTTLRAAAQLALAALELLDERDNTRAMLTDDAMEQVQEVADEAIDALKERLK